MQRALLQAEGGAPVNLHLQLSFSVLSIRQLDTEVAHSARGADKLQKELRFFGRCCVLTARVNTIAENDFYIKPREDTSRYALKISSTWQHTCGTHTIQKKLAVSFYVACAWAGEKI